MKFPSLGSLPPSREGKIFPHDVQFSEPQPFGKNLNEVPASLTTARTPNCFFLAGG